MKPSVFATAIFFALKLCLPLTRLRITHIQRTINFSFTCLADVFARAIERHNVSSNKTLAQTQHIDTYLKLKSRL